MAAMLIRIVLLLAIAMPSSCQKKSSTEVPGLPTGAVNEPTVTGVPTGASNATTLNLTVAGDGLTHYKYFETTGSTATCGGATYSDWTAIGTPLTVTLGKDGMQLLCVAVLNKGSGQITPESYRWQKDTVAPTTTASKRTAIGPNSDAGSVTNFSGTASDDNSGIKSVGVSIQSGSGKCLSDAKSAFSEACPHYIDAVGTTSWTLTVNDSLFTTGSTYNVKTRAVDLAGNIDGTGSSFATVSSTAASGSPSGLTTTTGQESLGVSWSAATSAASYIVLARTGVAVAYVPVASTTYKTGDYLGNSTVVAYAGSSTSFTHTALTAYNTYYYAVYALDGAGNIGSSAATGSGMPIETTAFKGVSNAFIFAPGGKITVEWLPYYDGSTLLSTISYNIYAASTAGGEDFTTPTATTSAGATSANITYSGSAANLYIVVREVRLGGTDTNTIEFKLNYGGGYHHKLVSTGRFGNTDPFNYTFLRAAYSVTMDPWDNIVFTGQNGTLHVMCQEATSAFYCKGRSLNRVYTIAGTDGLGDGASGVIATTSPMGNIQGLAIDPSGNIYLSDTTYFRIRAVCYSPQSQGFCNGKPVGYMYNLAGTGVTGDASTNVAASTAAFGAVNAIATDSKGNIVLGDTTNFKLRALC